MNLDVFSAGGVLLFGLLTGLSHCVGMCCPFVLWISGTPRTKRIGPWSRIRPHLMYSLGRTLTYSGLGAAAGALGGLLGASGNLLGIQRFTAILAGCLLLLYASAALFGSLPLARVESLGFVKRRVGKLLGQQPRNLFLVGILLGFLPCGPLYVVIIAAAGWGSAGLGALALALFGLGTWPAMWLLGVLGQVLVERRGHWLLMSHVLVLAMGIWFVWQGVQL